MESFRAAEIGVYGSAIDLTPRFDEWAMKGILFKNFFANGFQTRHGEIATYCSVMPNYGAAVLKALRKTNFAACQRCFKKMDIQQFGFTLVMQVLMDKQLFSRKWL